MKQSIMTKTYTPTEHYSNDSFTIGEKYTVEEVKGGIWYRAINNREKNMLVARMHWS